MTKLCYDFYFNGQFVKRFDSYQKAKSLVTWDENLTTPKNLYEIRTVFVGNEEKGEDNVHKRATRRIG